MLHSFLSSMTNIVGLDASKSYDGEASNYSVLPSASQYNNNHIYFVSNAVGNHQAGFYKSNGSSWVYVGHDHDSLDDISEGSTNKHFTDTHKTKLDGIEAGAEVNVNADWSSSSGDSQILNKPTANQLIDWTAENQGSIDVSNLPSLSLTTVQTAANESAQLGLTTQEGDVVVRSDQKKTYIRNSGSAGTMADFTLLETPTDAVTSVNGQTGAVTLHNGDVGLGNVVNVDTTNASNITSGTLNEARLLAIDADNTTISNLEVDNLKTGVLDTDLTAVSANDDTLASAKAIKAYVDATGITSAEQTKLGHISVTQAVDLDTMESNITTNNAKVSNATHTGDVTGSASLTIANNVVTNSKLSDISTGKVKGRTSAGTGEVEDLDIDTTLKTALNLSKSDVGLGNVENKSSATIRGEIVDSDIPSTIARDSEIPSGNQIIDWTTDQGSTNIHSGNYTNTTYSVQDGELSQNNFSDTLKNKLDAIEAGADVTDSTNVSSAGALMKSGGTMTGELQVNARLDVGDGSEDNTEIRIYKNDNNVSDHLQFYNGTTRVGEIGVEDTNWLRINQETNKNIYTPRMIRADGGFQVDGSNVISGDGVHTGDGSDLTSLNASNISSGTLNTARLPASATFGDGISTNGSDVYTDNGAFIAYDTNGDFADRTGTNIDHIWHDDTNNAWNFCSDTTYKGEGNSELKAKGLHIKSAGDARIIIEADTDNVTESDNAYIKMTQDGGAVGSIFGLCPGTNKDPENQTYTGTLSNSLLINNFYSGASITFGTNNSGTSAVRLRIAANGDLSASAKLICGGVARLNGATSYNNVALNSRSIGSATNDFIYYGEDSSGAGRFSVRSSDGTVWSSSDKRWKKNIESMSGILNKVCQCVLSKFHFKKQDDTDLKSIGFISQEIEPIFPELVQTLPDGFKSLSYDRFGAIAFQAIKELREEKDTQIQLLEERIKKLEAKL